VKSFFEKVSKQREARENPEKPYFYLAPDLLRKKVDQKKQESQKTWPKSDYDRSLTKSFEATQEKTRVGKGVTQLGQQSQQSTPPLIIRNEYGSNLDLPDVDFEEMVWFYEDTGLDLAQVLTEGPSAPKVDHWKKFEHGKSLYNPEALGELGTQMYLLNKWYMATCEWEENFISVRVRNQHYSCGDDVIYVEFLELHQLCHLDSLDKSLISCYYL
jgi:hypothetical protein